MHKFFTLLKRLIFFFSASSINKKISGIKFYLIKLIKNINYKICYIKLNNKFKLHRFREDVEFEDDAASARVLIL